MADSPHVTVRHTMVWDDFWTGEAAGHGIRVQRSPDFTAERNVIFKNGVGIQLVESPRATVTYNTVFKNFFGGLHFVRSVAGSTSRHNSLIYNHHCSFFLQAREKAELESFKSDYNNLGTYLRPASAEEQEPVTVLPDGSRYIRIGALRPMPW